MPFTLRRFPRERRSLTCVVRKPLLGYIERPFDGGSLVLKIAILDDYQNVALSMADWSLIVNRCELTVFNAPLGDQAATAATLAPFNVICLMRERTPFPRALFAALPALRCLITTGARNLSIDLQAASDNGVTVCCTRNGSTEYGTSELTWALILAASRHVSFEHRQLRAGHWQSTIGTTLCGKTLGLLGLGRIGGRVAALGRAFGMEVIAWSPNLTDARASAAGARRVDKEALFIHSDVVSIHLVLGDSTCGIVGRRELSLMPRHAVLVNTARGPLVDEQALVEVLQDRRIAAAGLDVFHHEPLPPDHPLLTMDHVVLTPHLGYVTRESYKVFFEDVAEDISAYLAGSPVRVLSP